MAASRWVLLSYRLPREPSTPRIALWRKLRRLGAVQVVDGLVALPDRGDAQEQLGWLADEVLEAGGTAMVWQARSTTAEQDRQLLERMADDLTAEYRQLLGAIEDEVATGPSTRGLQRLRREFQRITRRDHLKPPLRDDVEKALRAVAEALVP